MLSALGAWLLGLILRISGGIGSLEKIAIPRKTRAQKEQKKKELPETSRLLLGFKSHPPHYHVEKPGGFTRETFSVLPRSNDVVIMTILRSISSWVWWQSPRARFA